MLFMYLIIAMVAYYFLRKKVLTTYLAACVTSVLWIIFIHPYKSLSVSSSGESPSALGPEIVVALLATIVFVTGCYVFIWLIKGRIEKKVKRGCPV